MVQLSPGVQVIEKDYTEIVPSVSSSRGAFAGVFKWGPVEEPSLISSESKLVARYGKPNDDNYRSFFIATNFLDYSNQLYVARVDSGAARNAVARKSGKVSKITLTLQGSGYTAVPNVTIGAPAVTDGVNATAVAVLTGGAVTAYTVVNGGSGYALDDQIIFSRPEQTIDTKDANGNIVTRVYEYAKGRVSQISEEGAIEEIDFEADGFSFGNGYIAASSITTTIKNSFGTAASAGTGANITFAVAPSALKEIRITNGGSGYLDGQDLEVTIETDPDLQPTFIGVEATATVEITTSGNKIKNKADYDLNWANGQGAYGEFAAKYPGEMGNSISVSICDSENWRTGVKGLFSARKTVESKEDERELTYVRRVLSAEEAFSNEALDSGKALRTSSGKLIGYIDHIVESVKYRKITLTADSTYNVQLDQHVRHQSYGVARTISKVARTTGGAVTVTTTADHGLVAGDYVTVSSTLNPSVNVVNAVVVSSTNTTFTYQTEVYIAIAEMADSGTAKSQSQGTINGFVKAWDDVNDQYELSARQFYVTVANEDNDFVVGNMLVDTNGAVIGSIEAVEEVQTILMDTLSAADVYDESVFAEWKYKSLFNNNAPTTSAYTVKEGGSNDEIHVVVIDRDGRLTGVAGNVLEKFADLSKARDAKFTNGKSAYYKNVINAGSRWIWVLDHPVDVETTEGRAEWGGLARDGVFRALTSVVTRDLSGGVDTVNPSAGNLVTAYTLYNDPSAYDISLVPLDYMAASTAKTIVQEVVEKRKDCVAFLNPPLAIGTSNSIATSIVNFRNQLMSSSYAVLSSTWKYQYDKYSDKFRWVPLSGDVAGLCAGTDMIADPWYSPAGFNRGQIKNAVKLAFNPTLAQRDELYKNGVNPVVTFPADGTVLYGDKTLLTKPSAFDRINVRRLFIVLEKAISTASKYQLFEFNDDFTRAQFRSMVEPFLRDVQGRRGIVDFKVKCDTTNNTPEVIDSNEFVADIYIKPNRSINFITLNFIATKTGVNFDELGA